MVMWDINAGYIKPLLENKEGEKGEAEDYGLHKRLFTPKY